MLSHAYITRILILALPKTKFLWISMDTDFQWSYILILSSLIFPNTCRYWSLPAMAKWMIVAFGEDLLVFPNSFCLPDGTTKLKNKKRISWRFLYAWQAYHIPGGMFWSFWGLSVKTASHYSSIESYYFVEENDDTPFSFCWIINCQISRQIR